MAPIRVEALLTVLSKQKVVDAISAAIQPMIELAIAEALYKRFAELCTRHYGTKCNKKGQHRSCHTAKCNMLNKWLQTNKKFYTGHSYFHHHTLQTWPFHAHMHKYKPHTYNNIRTYTTLHQKVAKLSAATWRISSISCRSFCFGWDLRVLPPGEYHVIHTPMP